MCFSCRKNYFYDIFSRWKLSQFRYLCQSNALPSHIKVNSKITKFEEINVFLFDLVYVLSCLILINIKVNSKITKFEQINVIELCFDLVYISLQFLSICPPPQLSVSRQSLFEDSFHQIMRLPAYELRRRLYIIFRWDYYLIMWWKCWYMMIMIMELPAY